MKQKDMRTNSLNNSFSLLSYKNLNNIRRYIATIAVVLCLAFCNVGVISADDYNTRLKGTATEGGSVFVASESTPQPESYTGTNIEKKASGKGENTTYYVWAVPKEGYYWSGWTLTNSTKTDASITAASPHTATAQSVTCRAPNGTSSTYYDDRTGRKFVGIGTYHYWTNYSIQANFAAIKVNSYDGHEDLLPTNPSTAYPGSATFTLYHEATPNDLNIGLTPADGNSGKFEIVDKKVDDKTVTVNYTFTGNNTNYGGANRNNSAVLLVESLGDKGNGKSCTINANFPALAFVGVEATDVYATQGESGKTGSATFTYKYGAKDDFPNAPTLTHVSGSGSFSVTRYTVIPNFSTGVTAVMVEYKFNTNNVVGETVEQLKLTAANGLEKTVTITGHSEELATNEVRVTEANGDLVDECDWPTAISTYQATDRTFTILRDINLGTITATNNITKAMTIDLNGKELRAAVNATSVGILTITQAVELTIKDSRGGGKIINEVARDSEIRTIFVNKAGATLTLESGTLVVNNTGQYASAAATVNGVSIAKYASCAARVIHQEAGSTVNIKGGRVEAHGTHSVFGIVQASSASTNNAGTTLLNVTGGEIYAEAPSHAYGIQGYGKVNYSGGNITVKINTNMIDARYAADNVNNKYNGFGYGILMSAYANATASSCYYGTLEMTGGNINVTNDRVYDVDRRTYGVLIDCSYANMGSGEAEDGSKCQKAAAKGTITGGKITMNSGTNYTFGVYMSGSYNSYDNKSHVLKVKNCTIDVTGRACAYGVFSHASINSTNGGCYHGDIELTDCDVTAETTVGAHSYAAFVTSNMTIIYKNTSPEAAAYYHGEYAVAGKLTINSGTYKAYAKTTNAYCVNAGYSWTGDVRARTMYADETNEALKQSLGGNKEAYPELIIHGGDFYAETYGQSAARAVSSGGHTTIDGGSFKAVAKTTNAYGLAAMSGTMKVSGVKVEAEGDATVYGVLVNADISAYTLFDYAAEVELNNLDVTATTRTGTNARGVSVSVATKTQTEAMREALSGTTRDNYYNIYQVAEKATAGKVKINGGTYRANAATQNAYGVYLSPTAVSTTGAASASAEGEIRNATFISKTVPYEGPDATSTATTYAYGIRAGGPTIIDGCDITVQPTTTNGYGVYIDDKKTTLNNTKITVTTANTVDATKSAAAYGIYNNASISTIGWKFEGELEANDGNDVTVTTTSGTTAYGVWTHAITRPITSEVYTAAGTYPAEATTIINGGKYSAHANNTNGINNTGYALGVQDPQRSGEIVAIPTCIINDGKFKGTAGAAPFADVSLAGEPGYFVLNGGYYVKDENLDKKLGEGMNKVAVNSGTPEYTEGYRWRITDNMTGEYVCKIKENGISYASLEEALQVVNANPNSTWTIIMIANYTLAKGDYVLPANTTLLIPYKSDQTTINGTTPAWIDEGNETPYPYCKLTFASGVNMTVSGKIEASSTTYIVSGNLTGIVGGAYGWLQLNEGAHIDLESGADMFAWGYVTGEGTINAKPGSCIYEDFQMGDWRGGGVAFAAQGNKNGINGKGVFLITHYFVQNVECEVTYRPGSQSIAYTGTYMTAKDTRYQAKSEPIKMVGTSGAMFLMNTATAGADTWVKKKYNTNTDRLEWTLNSGAELGSISMNLKFENLPWLITVVLGGSTVNVNSADYVLPITSNFTITANYGEIKLSNDVCFIPGSEVIINKEAVLTVPSGYNVFIYDSEDWSQYGRYYYLVGYSPSWKVSPRNGAGNTKLPDAKFEVAGLLKISGALYTTSSGANICSTRENAGKVLFNVAPASSLKNTSTTTSNTGLQNYFCQITASSGGALDCEVTYTAKPINPAWLKNENGTYSTPTSADTKAGDTWVYMKSLTKDTYEWTLASENGCFTIRKTDDTKTYVHPSDWVAVGEANDDHAYPSEDGTRMFVNTEAASTDASCKWWDVNPTPEVIDEVTYYVANNENFDNFGTYYYYWEDENTSYWKPKKITVTWLNEDGTKITNGTYGDEYNFNTSPQFFGTNPKKTATDIEKYDWIGWRDEEGNIYDKNATLPRATSNVTYTAYFNTTKYQYTITFKNDDNSDLWAGLVDAGTTGAELQALFEQKYNEKTGSTVPQKAPTEAEIFTFDHWDPALETVTAAATYTAQYSRSTRKYHVTFYNYDAVSVLYEADVDYDTAPTYSGVTPFRANTSAYSYNWTGWQQGATTYGTSDELPVVKGDISYIATFEQTELKYQVLFKRQDGSIIDAPFFTYGEIPSAFPANPKMASTVSTDYTFREWSPATLEPVTEDGKVYTALFDESPRQYTAHFVNYNGVSLNKDQTIDYNKVPEYTGATPFKPNDARNSYVFSGWAWAAGDGWEAGSIAAGEAFPAIKGNITFTAQFTPTLLQLDAGFYVDIVDVDNTKKTLTLNVSGTEWVTAGWPYEVNGTVYYRDQAKATAASSDKYRATDRTLTIPYTGEPGENFTVTIRNASSTLVSKHTYIIPQEITSKTELTANQTKPIFVKGTTLTINGNISAQKIYVGPDAKLIVNSATLTADAVYLRTTPESAAELELIDNGKISGKVYYTRIIKSKSGYFQFGLPLSCPISAVRLSNNNTVGYKTSSGWILRYYDEASRATKGPGENWATLDASASIAAGKGYEMYSGVNYYREFYFPVDLTALTNKVAVSYTAGSQTVNNGWNVIVSPLTHTLSRTPEPEDITVSWMQLDGSFEQENPESIAPVKTFAYQAVKAGSISFGESSMTVPTLAPRRRVTAAEEPTRIQWIHLDIASADGEGDQTSVYSHPTRYEQTYKTGIDVAKQSLTASRAILYSSHAYGDMAFAGVADELLEQGVALTVYSPATQELTFSLRDNDWLNRMEYVWLIDKETGAKIDLLSSDYSYEAAEGTTRGRFFIQGQFKAPQVATELEPTSDSSLKGREIRKVIINQKMFIEVNGRLYDATGKEVKR